MCGERVCVCVKRERVREREKRESERGLGLDWVELGPWMNGAGLGWDLG